MLASLKTSDTDTTQSPKSNLEQTAAHSTGTVPLFPKQKVLRLYLDGMPAHQWQPPPAPVQHRQGFNIIYHSMTKLHVVMQNVLLHFTSDVWSPQSAFISVLTNSTCSCLGIRHGDQVTGTLISSRSSISTIYIVLFCGHQWDVVIAEQVPPPSLPSTLLHSPPLLFFFFLLPLLLLLPYLPSLFLLLFPPPVYPSSFSFFTSLFLSNLTPSPLLHLPYSF